jgi:hypothetical protein
MNNDIKALRMLSMALIVGIFMFSAISFLIIKMTGGPLAANPNLAIFYAGLIIAVIMLPFAFISFKKDSAAAAAIEDDSKMTAYRAAIIKQFAFFEGVGIFNVIAYLLVGNLISLGVALFTLLLMFIQMPTEEKFNRFG